MFWKQTNNIQSAYAFRNFTRTTIALRSGALNFRFQVWNFALFANMVGFWGQIWQWSIVTLNKFLILNKEKACMSHVKISWTLKFSYILNDSRVFWIVDFYFGPWAAKLIIILQKNYPFQKQIFMKTYLRICKNMHIYTNQRDFNNMRFKKATLLLKVFNNKFYILQNIIYKYLSWLMFKFWKGYK